MLLMSQQPCLGVYLIAQMLPPQRCMIGWACKHLWLAGVACFLSIMSEGDVMTMSVQQQRSQLFRAASQLVGLSRYGSGSCVINAALGFGVAVQYLLSQAWLPWGVFVHVAQLTFPCHENASTSLHSATDLES